MWKTKTLFCLHPQHSLFLRHFPIRYFSFLLFQSIRFFLPKYLRDMVGLQSYKIYQLIRGNVLHGSSNWRKLPNTNSLQLLFLRKYCKVQTSIAYFVHSSFHIKFKMLYIIILLTCSYITLKMKHVCNC